MKDHSAFSIRQALRALSRARPFTLGAAATFGLGIGINLAVFGAVDRILFRPLPYASPDRLFLMDAIDVDSAQRLPLLPARYVAEARARLSFIERMATLGDSSGYFMSPDLDEPEIRISHVTSGMLDLTGVRPRLGRGFTPDDERVPGTAAVLTWEGWQRRYAGDPGVLGRRIYSRRGSMEIVGVLPPGYIPAGGTIDPGISGLTTMRDIQVVRDDEVRTLPPAIRLRPGVSRQAAQAQLDALVARLEPLMTPRKGGRLALRLVPIREAMFGRYKPYVLLVVVGAGLVLVVACANLAGLFLLRRRSRLWDAAVRMSIGASPGRLLRETLVESLIVCLAGAGIALVVLHWSSRSLDALLPAIFSGFRTSGVDTRVALFALGTAVLASLMAAAVPSIVLGRLDVLPILQRGGSAQSSRRAWSGRALLAAEAALGVILAAGALVTARSYAGLAASDLGFDAGDLYLVNMRAPAGADLQGRRDEMTRVLARLRDEPGVVSAGASPMLSVLRTGSAPFAPDGPPCCRWLVSDGYLEAVNVPIVAGRLFSDADVRRADVALLNVRAVQQLWPGLVPAAAVGRMLRFDGEPAREVIGVVGDTRRGHDEDALPALYLPLTDGASGLLVVRTGPGIPLPYSTVRPIVEERAGSTLLYVRAMTPMYARTLEAPRFRAALFAAFAVVALLVAMAGLYALVGFEAATRQRELGVRMTLGASRRNVVMQMLGAAVRPVLAGSMAGLVIAWWAAQFVQSFLHEVDARDPLLLALVAAILIVTSLAAAAVPARRAARTDPAAVLRAP